MTNFSADTETFEILEQVVSAKAAAASATKENEQPPPSAEEMPPPMQVFKVLQEQNDRIQRLTEQVEQLLSERSSGAGSVAGSEDSHRSNASVSRPGVAEISTQTSAPSSPRKAKNMAETATSTRELSA